MDSARSATSNQSFWGGNNQSIGPINEYGFILGTPVLSPTTDSLRKIVEKLDYYIVPLIILIGFVGNTMSFIVFVATHLRRHSCNVYLASLALADNLFLFCVFISWSDKIGISLYYQPGWCQVLVYLTYVSSFLSVWYIVAFTLERYILVCSPLKRHTLCTTRVAKILTTCLALLSLLAYSFSIVMAGVIDIGDMKICAPLPAYFRIVSTVNNIDTLVTLVMPTIIIIGCNIRIAYVVCTFYKTCRQQPELQPCRKWDFSQFRSQRSTLTHHRRSASSFGNIVPVTPTLPRSSHMRATRMLLIVSTVFLFCNLPSHAVRTYAFVSTMINPGFEPSHGFMICQQFFQILYYMNFSVNFFLYNLSGRSFRLGLRRIGTKLKKKVRKVFSFNQRDKTSPSSSPRLLTTRTEMNPQLHSYNRNIMFQYATR